MNSFAAIVAVLALVVPAPRAAPLPAPDAAREAHSRSHTEPVSGPRSEADAFRGFREGYRPETLNQVRIEQHLTIRITPSSPSLRREMLMPPQSDGPVRYKEKKHDDCVEVANIAGITPMEPNRLVLFMRNHHILSASLERACDADAFYLGAYVERSDDGKLCVGRDTLRARTGASCKLSRISRLVAVKD